MRKERLEELQDGDSVATPGAEIAKMEIPSWFDRKKFERAKEVYKEYFAAVNFSHFCGLIMSFYFTKALKTLRSTGESDTTHSLLHRYLMTVRHVQKWYEGDVWDPDDPAQRSLSAVRSLHTAAGKRMAALQDGVVYVSQWEMVLTQWAFVGPMVLFRTRVGLHGCTDRDYECLVHFWRTIGHILGVEERFNLCSGDYDQVHALCEDILDKEYRKQMSASHPDAVSMGRNVASAMNLVDHLLTWPSICSYVYELAGLPCPESMGILDWIAHSLMRFMMLYLSQFDKIRLMFNDMYRWRLDKAEELDLRLRNGKMDKKLNNQFTYSSDVK